MHMADLLHLHQVVMQAIEKCRLYLQMEMPIVIVGIFILGAAFLYLLILLVFLLAGSSTTSTRRWRHRNADKWMYYNVYGNEYKCDEHQHGNHTHCNHRWQ